MPLQIEQLATRADLLPVVASWIYEEWWKDVEGASLGKLRDLLSAHLVPDQMPLTFVASLDTRPVGTASLLAHDIGTEQWPQRSPWLAAVYVVPAHRRHGIGTSLINTIVAQAGAMGTKTLYLLTTEREKLYSRLGWEVCDRQEERTVMSRPTASQFVDEQSRAMDLGGPSE